MIPVDLSQTVRVGSMIRTDPGSRSLGSDPGIHFRDPRTCLPMTEYDDGGLGGGKSTGHFSGWE